MHLQRLKEDDSRCVYLQTFETALFWKKMSTIQIELNRFLMLMFACCANSLKLCSIAVEKLLFDRKLVALLS